MRNVLEGELAEHLLRLLAGEIQISFERLQRQVTAQAAREGWKLKTSSETELESLIRQARRKHSNDASAELRQK